MLKKMKQDIEQLKKDVELLKGRRVREGGKVKEMADWIEKLFEKNKIIPVNVIMEKGKRHGYSEQMLSIARRRHLGDKIKAYNAEKKGWVWIYETE